MKLKLKKYNSIGIEELNAAKKVVSSGKLSQFVAGNTREFFGGSNIKKFEKYLTKFYNVKYAITVNSWTSGLIAIVGSLDIEPGDEIIVTPWTMCATSTAILHWNCIPVFADIDKNSFNLDPNDVKKKITSKTKAIIAADIFGYPCDIDSLKKVVGKRKIKIITDSAQAPYSHYKGKLTGTLSDIGGFSLNFHKIINTGEGGIIVTNNDKLAKRVMLIRNHGEVRIKTKNKSKLSNIIGHNFRMGEIEAAIGLQQYKKLKKIVKDRTLMVNNLMNNLAKLPFIILPKIEKNFSHNFYILPIVLDEKIQSKRKKIVKLFREIGIEGANEGYANLHLLPMFIQKIAYGKKHFPWNLNDKKYNYKRGICKVAEELHHKSFISLEICLYDLNKKTINELTKAFKFVWHKLNIKKSLFK
jgi:perosamine synthetase